MKVGPRKLTSPPSIALTPQTQLDSCTHAHTHGAFSQAAVVRK